MSPTWTWCFCTRTTIRKPPVCTPNWRQRFITWMTALTPAGNLFDIDIALRPDGASGLLVSSFATFESIS